MKNSYFGNGTQAYTFHEKKPRTLYYLHTIKAKVDRLIQVPQKRGNVEMTTNVQKLAKNTSNIDFGRETWI